MSEVDRILATAGSADALWKVILNIAEENGVRLTLCKPNQTHFLVLHEYFMIRCTGFANRLEWSQFDRFTRDIGKSGIIIDYLVGGGGDKMSISFLCGVPLFWDGYNR